MGEAGRGLDGEFPYNGKTWLRWLIAMSVQPYAYLCTRFNLSKLYGALGNKGSLLNRDMK